MTINRAAHAPIFSVIFLTHVTTWPEIMTPSCSAIVTIPGTTRQRAARLSAAVKRYKTYRMLSFIFEIAESVDLDFTPLVVKRLCTALFGRSGSQNIIVATFGQKRSHSPQP
jgi:hypothetical protein